tara:strand:- start:9218 stop:11842 length:2625 start_codon:yes stop_codon:yes gene_type:complete
MKLTLITIIFFCFNLKADPLTPLPTDFFDDKKVKFKKNKKSPNKKNQKKGYEDLTKNMESITGFFDFYIDKEKNKVYLSIKPEQLNMEFLMGLTRQAGDGYQFDGSSMLGEGVFFFKKIGEAIQLVEKNTKFRAKESRAIYKSVKNHIPNSIIASSKILSEPQSTTEAILVDANKFFIYDFSNVSRRTNNKYNFDKENSYFNYIKSFPLNSEIDFYIHYKSKNPNNRFTLAESKSMMHRYHVSMSAIEQSNYTPRMEDDRVGYFSTIHQDYSNTLKEDPHVRYINRWNLKKENPHQKLSKPEKPIVFWLENTIPIEFRDAVKKGILAWNQAFEKIGFIDAIVVKQMPDDADWDPADVRYNTIRWLVQPESAYAVGPSRANPYTGELYDADIRISNDYVRFYFDDFENFIDPILEKDIVEIWESDNHSHSHDNHTCNYGEHLKHKMAFTWNYLISNNIIVESEESMMKFVEDGIIDLLLHEVGHTLGLRHNFKASSVFTFDQLSDTNFTSKYGVTGSVMDYNATNLLDGGVNYFQTKPGPYDYWAIEYGYSNPPFTSKINEKDWLNTITSKSTEPWLAYGTDEDSYGTSIDPLINRRDMTSDPIRFYENQIKIANKYWDDLLVNFEKEGNRYPKLRSVFWAGMSEYYGASRNIPKFIGGIHHSRHHIGQKSDVLPMTVVNPDEQRKALNFLLNNILSSEAFSFEPEFLNKMAPERYGDLSGSMWRMSRIDFPIHNIVKALQKSTLSKIHNPRIIHRLHDNMLKVNSKENMLSIFELFEMTSNELWIELEKFDEINSFRRETQSFYIDLLAIVYFDTDNMFPRDTKSIAYSTLKKIKSNISEALPYYVFDDETTYAHLRAMIDKIDSVLEAQLIKG